MGSWLTDEEDELKRELGRRLLELRDGDICSMTNQLFRIHSISTTPYHQKPSGLSFCE